MMKLDSNTCPDDNQEFFFVFISISSSYQISSSTEELILLGIAHWIFRLRDKAKLKSAHSALGLIIPYPLADTVD